MSKLYAVIGLAYLFPAAYVGAADADGGFGPEPMQPTLYELRWDNGTLGYVRTHFLGGRWVANDFDASTLTATRVRCLRFYSSDNWPNGTWDGCHIAVYRLSGGLPGRLLWGPEFARGTGAGFQWCSFDVGWALPKGVLTFVAAVEQPYGYPNCDPYCLDTSPATGRAWTYYQGIWEQMETYTNLMLRVVMEGDIGVEPTSIGRVKALYY